MPVVLMLIGLFTVQTGPPPHRIELNNGDVLHVVLLETTNDAIVVEHPTLGRLTIPRSGIASMTSPSDLPTPAPPTPPIESLPPDPALTQPVPSRWETSLDLSLSAKAGKTDSADFRIGLTSRFRDAARSYRFDASYLVSTDTGSTTDDEATAGVLADWTIAKSRWSIFAQGRYDFDQFQSWQHRVNVGGGGGYLLIDDDYVAADGTKSDRLTLRGRVGIGARREFGSENDETEPEMILGLDVDWFITGTQRFTGDMTLYPTIGGRQNRVITNAQWVFSLDAMRGLNLKIGLHHEYQAETDPGVDPNDLTLFTGLSLAF